VRTERILLRIGKSDGLINDVPLRYNASHQRGYRCFIGPLADAPDEIKEDTPRSFEGRSLFDALAEYRKRIEPQGWRLLHAVARRDCWPKPTDFAHVQRLTSGIEQTEQVNGFDAARFDEVTTLEDQRAAFERWMKGLAPIREGRVPPRAGHEHDSAGVEFGPISRLAGRILSQKDD
jgi:hypothetical protein